MGLPSPRGPVSAWLIETLRRPPHTVRPRTPPTTGDPLRDDDLHLALYLCYELHYRGLPAVDDRWEWEPSLLEVRFELERRFEEGLLEAVPLTPVTGDAAPLGAAESSADRGAGRRVRRRAP